MKAELQQLQPSNLVSILQFSPLSPILSLKSGNKRELTPPATRFHFSDFLALPGRGSYENTGTGLFGVVDNRGQAQGSTLQCLLDAWLSLLPYPGSIVRAKLCTSLARKKVPDLAVPG